MSRHVLWPHRLVFDFPYGRWCTLLFLFTFMFLLFYSLGSMSNLREEASPLFFCFIIAYIIPASHYINEQTVAAFESLRPNLNLDLPEIEEIRDSLVRVTQKTQTQVLAVGFLAGCAHSYFLVTARGGLIETLQTLALSGYIVVATTILIWCLFTTIISFLISNVRIFARLARDNIRIDLLNSSSLRPFSRVAVYSTLVLVGALASFPLLLVEDETNYLSVFPGFFATFLPMVFIFLTPLLPIKKRIRECKSQELASIQDRISRLTASKRNLAENEEILSELQPLLNYRREVKQVPEWPFDSPVVFRLVFYLIIPPASWVGSALIERLVDSVNL